MERLTALTRETKWAIGVAVGYSAWDTVVALLARDWIAAAIFPGLAALGASLVLRARNQRMASDLFIGAAMLASIVLL